MADTFVQLPDDTLNLGKKEDHQQIANGNLRETVTIGDPTTVAAVASVLNADPGASEYGATVRDINTPALVATLGAVADASVTGDSTGTVSAKLRGINKILADVWNSVSHFISVSIVNATLAVTQSGAWTFGLAPATSGGCSDYHIVATGTNADKANIKASAGQLYGVHVYNVGAVPCYVKFHNTAGVPTPGAGVIATFGVQAGTQRDAELPNGIAFGTGLGITITTGIADADTTGVAAASCVVDAEYK